MIKLHLIVAVGRNGQIGFKNNLPWKRNSDDLTMFRRMTDGHDIIVGNRTAEFLPELPNRKIHTWDGRSSVSDFLAAIENQDIRVAWLCGGAHTYRAFAPFVNGNRIFNCLEYDGPADTYFPFDAYYDIENQNGLFRHRSDTIGTVQGRSEI